ncbi:MAG: hypothetical protein C0471_01115 [Erythrobacter sp.]|nr:hypothetical protein [Erythrobacter sp.]
MRIRSHPRTSAQGGLSTCGHHTLVPYQTLRSNVQRNAGDPLPGTSWRLLALQPMDDAQGIIRIKGADRYTNTLGADGAASMKEDFNQGLIPLRPSARAQTRDRWRSARLARRWRWATQIREFIVEQLDQMHRVPRLKQAAAHLGISTRTIVRSLARHDTSFHKLVEEERKARALALIADTSLSLADVAAALGFNDMSSFGRSFRNWFGDTPGNFRNMARQPDAAVPEDAPCYRA